ncbi:MAG: IS66 family insertion sequence element accessory protein TnpB, partial [Phyllobacteriaceae bacterium]|nr:IS66 family insertion sequence element accessory protein TnpB [Phyllobacteriaceae bacterium]
MKNELHKDPFTGTVFVFRAKKTDRLKLLYWDGTGLVMAYKRLEEHSFSWPAVTDGLMTVSHAQF